MVVAFFWDKSKHSFIVTNAKYQSIHIQFYEPEKNPNRVIYFNETIPDFDAAATDRWLDFELTNSFKSDVVNQVLTIYSDSYVSIQFQIVHTDKLDLNYVWNYFGIFPKYIKTSELSITHTDVMSHDIYITRPRTTPTLLGEIQLSLASFRASVRTLQKQDKKEEMEIYLHIPDIESVPFVTPVHQRFSSIYKLNSQKLIEKHPDEQERFEEELLDEKFDSNSDIIPMQGYTLTGNLGDIETRLSQLEGRNQILELVLKTYYIDDKVFRELYSPPSVGKVHKMEHVDSGNFF
ncbi:hypothetical protein MFLAVUS_007604 [Mucor flavus]|uniref:Uncharacterized protein n=1 Tax=Mucor flavus TaxID=439312 RepID=A0ABP9Z4S9_9FUNG